jgi:hypothetical protein
MGRNGRLWLAIGWIACGLAQAQDSARVIRTVSLPSFGFGVVTQTAEVRGALAGQSSRYETTVAQPDRQGFVGVTEGFFEVPGGMAASLVPDPFVPSVVETVYEVRLPEGFELRTALPDESVKTFGPAMLTRNATRTADGSLRFLVRLDTSKAQFAPEMAAKFRKELAESLDGVAALKVPFALSAFELAAFEQRVAKRPDDPIEHIRLAEGLKTLGLMDRALAQANTAVRLDPNSAPGLLSLARMRESDPLGRMFQAGFDRAGALDALRRLRSVDPHYLVGRYELVTLLEYDTDGVRYSYAAPLADAANELLEVRKLPGYEDRWDAELLQLLGMSGQFDQVAAVAAGMKLTEPVRNWILASSFYVGGEKAARKAAAQMSLDKAATAQAFYGAAGALEIARQYDKARALMLLSSVDSSRAGYRAAHLQILSRIRRHEEEPLDATDPLEALRRNLEWMMRPAARAAKSEPLLSRESLRIVARDPDFSQAAVTFGTRDLNLYTQQGYTVDQAIDVALANWSPNVEGNPQDGYIVRGNNRSEQSEAYVVIEGGKARLLGTANTYRFAGPEALARLDAGLNDEALAVLTWAAKFVHPATNGDPFAASPLIHFWPVPEEGRAESIRFAAAALAATLGDPDALPVLVKGRSAATSDERRLDFDTALAAEYLAQQDWKDLAPVAERLSNAYLESVAAFKYRTLAYRGLKDWKKADAVVDDWLAHHKDDPDGVTARAVNLTYEGKWHEGRALLAPLIAAGTATTAMANQFAWLSVAANEVDDSAVQAALDATQDFARRNVPAFGVDHTLACVYAMSGRPKEALDVLTKAMDTGGMAAPDSAAWFALGLIAEAHGDVKSAAVDYGRVQPDARRDGNLASTYNLAQRRLARK